MRMVPFFGFTQRMGSPLCVNSQQEPERYACLPTSMFDIHAAPVLTKKQNLKTKANAKINRKVVQDESDR